MVDKLKEMPAMLLEFWNKYTAKQKAIYIQILYIKIYIFKIYIFKSNNLYNSI